MPPYCAGKVALGYSLEGIGMELRPQGVAGTVVQPGFMRTPAAEGVKDSMPFILETDEAAEIIDGAIRNRRRKITFPWMLAMIEAPSMLAWLTDFATGLESGTMHIWEGGDVHDESEE
jgi:short-subunit dehydrogenase